MKVTYVLKDGTKLDTMKGYVIPYREDTARLYQKVARVLMTPKGKTS
ncbi:BOW99_gp33 family protein [Leuconostoc lactis]|nr:hypothetical protein [Leuconostoc lactis]